MVVTFLVSPSVKPVSGFPLHAPSAFSALIQAVTVSDRHYVLLQPTNRRIDVVIEASGAFYIVDSHVLVSVWSVLELNQLLCSFYSALRASASVSPSTPTPQASANISISRFSIRYILQYVPSLLH